MPVIRALEKLKDRIEVRVGATGQHAMLFDQIAEIEGLDLAWNLEAMKPRQQIPALIGRMIKGLETPIRHVNPTRIVVAGDSASTLAASIAGHAAGVPVAHIEAGLRGTLPGMPYPEETFRKMVSAAAALHIAPTEEARQNLLRENIDDSIIQVLGDPGRDALARKLQGCSSVDDPELRGIDWSKPLAVATVVRRDNHTNGVYIICDAFKRIARDFPGIQVVIANHLNPHLMEPIRQLLCGLDSLRITLPLPHQLFINLLRRADLAVTDSGGVQEEAAAMGIPILSLRACRDTGRDINPSLVCETGSDADALVSAFSRKLSHLENREKKLKTIEAAEPVAPRIAEQLARFAESG
jgi:UDP-N-acetylglucosamine 2-epimerase (non-hydrolysing)